MAKKKIFDEDISYIIKGFFDGKTSRQLAKEMNCSKTLILNIWKENNLYKDRIPKDKINYIINNYQLDIKDISNNVELCIPTVRKILIENNLFINHEEKIKQRNDLIKNELKEGNTITEISQKYQLSESQIRNIVNLKINKQYRRKIQISDKEKNFLIDNYNKFSSSQLSEITNISRGTITKVWHDNNLHGKDISRQYYCNFNYFQNIDSSDKAYIIGLLASDGCIYKRDGHQGCWQISLQEQDKHILDKISNKIKSDKPIIGFNKKDGSLQYCLSINSEIMYNNLKTIGLFDAKTYDIKTSEIKIPFCFWKDYFRGYFDGDGCIALNKPKSNKNITPTCFVISFI